MTILLGCTNPDAHLTLRSKQLVTLAQCYISCRMVANALQIRRPPTEHRKWELSLHRQKGTHLFFRLGSCMPWPIGQWRWQDLVALSVGLQCIQRYPRKVASLRTFSKWHSNYVNAQCGQIYASMSGICPKTIELGTLTPFNYQNMSLHLYPVLTLWRCKVPGLSVEGWFQNQARVEVVKQ